MSLAGNRLLIFNGAELKVFFHSRYLLGLSVIARLRFWPSLMVTLMPLFSHQLKLKLKLCITVIFVWSPMEISLPPTQQQKHTSKLYTAANLQGINTQDFVHFQPLNLFPLFFPTFLISPHLISRKEIKILRLAA